MAKAREKKSEKAKPKAERLEKAPSIEREEKPARKEEHESIDQQASEIAGKRAAAGSGAEPATIPSRTSSIIEANKIISEDIKSEIYQISEVVLDEKVREFSKRISELELFRAQTLESLSEMNEELAELRSMISKQKIGSVEQLTKINEQLNSLSGNVSAMEKVVVSSLDGLTRSVGEKKR